MQRRRRRRCGKNHECTGIHMYTRTLTLVIHRLSADPMPIDFCILRFYFLLLFINISTETPLRRISMEIQLNLDVGQIDSLFGRSAFTNTHSTLGLYVHVYTHSIGVICSNEERKKKKGIRGRDHQN